MPGLFLGTVRFFLALAVLFNRTALLFLRTSASNSLLGGAMGADSICRAAFSIAGRSRQSGQAAPFSRAPDSWTLVDRPIARTAEQQAVPSFPLTSEFLSCLQIEPWVQISTPT